MLVKLLAHKEPQVRLVQQEQLAQRDHKVSKELPDRLVQQELIANYLLEPLQQMSQADQLR
jgi:hypothetical protein